MKENKLAELSLDFSIEIINLVQFLKTNKTQTYFTKGQIKLWIM